jgi:hypothetical protein
MPQVSGYYRYDFCKLDNPVKDLRILQIRPVTSSDEDPISANLVKLSGSSTTENGHSAGVAIARREMYNALSWCWRAYNREEDLEDAVIYLLQFGKHYELKISASLNKALKVLRTKGVLNVWVDWICINQHDTDERSNQVQMMGTIYGEAECVYIWLGDEKDGSQMAFDFIPELHRIEKFGRLMDESNHDKWKALTKLMMRDWFSRRWIIQEIALAKRAELLCGKAHLDWEFFADAISLFNVLESGKRTVNTLMMARKEFKHMPDYLGSISALGAARLVDVTDHLFQRSEKAKYRQDRLQSLEHLVSTFTAFNATEARDTIYAILAIAKDTTPQTKQQVESVLASPPSEVKKTVDITEEKIAKKSKQFAAILKKFAVQQLGKHQAERPYNVDYSLPVSNIYVDFVKFCIEGAKAVDASRALDIFCRPWAPDPDFFKQDAVEASFAHGHWRARFGRKSNYDGKPYTDDQTNRWVLQSPRTPPEWKLEQNAGLSDKIQDLDQDTIPSWIPSVKQCAYGWVRERGDPKMTRSNADVLVGEPGQRLYHASGSKGVTKALKFEDGIIEDPTDESIHNTHYHSAYVEGFVLGTIAQISERSQSGQIPKKWSTLVEHGPTTEASSDGGLWSRQGANDFWRTLVGDMSYTGQNPPRCYRLILDQAYNGEEDVDLEKLYVHYGDCDPAVDVARRIHAVIWSRRLMRVQRETTTGGPGEQSLGLAPDTAERGDLVCILYGCSVPVVLRRYKKSPKVIESQIWQQKIEAGKKLHHHLKLRMFRRILESMADREKAKASAINGQGSNAAGTRANPRKR